MYSAVHAHLFISIVLSAVEGSLKNEVGRQYIPVFAGFNCC